MATRADTGAGEARARRYDPAETRQRVLEAANELFSKQGFAKTGTADIARAADVSEGSIFYHFGSKRALLEELGRAYGERMCLAMQRDDALGDITPAMSIRRCFTYCETHSTWEELVHANSADGTKAGMSNNPDAEPFYRASRQVIVDWVEQQYEAMKAQHDLKHLNVPIAAALTCGVVGDALDLAFGPEISDEVRKEVEDETVRFISAACGMDHCIDSCSQKGA
ncbi:TetR/AcrR family transcriptional regulator [Pacificimonas sp. WHA3]|uniref:TetR/AcrR family transcriptional regulator n=1 Tax=Pacificimonas pallii TaxID=2827236 RepID=A0ABS6SAX5_9SPHN|nr:TetR/AcrR family transcriptional regulator [Pacificimonas pallii]MBV7255553.1 TetR/AcrR family transcriptional regulator [Pacificimonas pallii]